jgi:Protein of unknown function (DUF433)
MADPVNFSGKPIICGMRISVEMIVSFLAQGELVDDIIDVYPDLEPADTRLRSLRARGHCLRLAQCRAGGGVVKFLMEGCVG